MWSVIICEPNVWFLQSLNWISTDGKSATIERQDSFKKKKEKKSSKAAFPVLSSVCLKLKHTLDISNKVHKKSCFWLSYSAVELILFVFAKTWLGMQMNILLCLYWLRVNEHPTLFNLAPFNKNHTNLLKLCVERSNSSFCPSSCWTMCSEVSRSEHSKELFAQSLRAPSYHWSWVTWFLVFVFCFCLFAWPVSQCHLSLIPSSASLSLTPTHLH